MTTKARAAKPIKKYQSGPDYKALMNQLITELDQETNQQHRVELVTQVANNHNITSADGGFGLLTGFTEAHNRVRRIVAKFAERIPADEAPEPAPVGV